jgi:hypothetical protein
VGTATTVLLALVGTLMASWLSACTRLMQFAALRALGTAPNQLAGVMNWELPIISATALTLEPVFARGFPRPSFRRWSLPGRPPA